MNITKKIIIVLIVHLIFSCENIKEKSEKTTVSNPIIVPTFNADSAYVFVKNQVDFGPRVPNTPEHFACGKHLIKQLESYGAVVMVQEFKVKAYDNTILNLRNIIGSFNPRAKKRILLAAHWDTRPFADKAPLSPPEGGILPPPQPAKPIDGANDGASGIGVLLEIARLIHNNAQNDRHDISDSVGIGGEKSYKFERAGMRIGLQIGIDMIFFDGEDYGQPNDETPRKKDTWCLGSQYWARNPHKKDYYAKMAILLDMVGAKGAKFAMEGTSRHFAPDVVKKVWSTANRLGYSDYFWYYESPEIVDDHTYINHLTRIKMIDIIEHDPEGDSYFGSYWHTHQDNMDIIDKRTLKAVGQTLVEVIYRER